MFVKNKTLLPVVLPRGHIGQGVFAAALVTTVVFRLGPEGTRRWEGTRAPLPTDPPSTHDRALWHGASVTVAGTVRGPGRLPHIAKVSLRVGDSSRSLLVLGDRQWVRNAGKLVASPPSPWETMSLSWDRSFGGTVVVPPGPVGPSKLPHPGGHVGYPLNPGGKGFCLDEKKAEGMALPNIESPQDAVRAPLDRPVPAGFAPCPELPALRAPQDLRQEDAIDPERMLLVALRMAHAAPGALIFPALPAGIAVEIAGMGPDPLRFQLPPCPVRVTVRKGKGATELPPAIRAVHVSTDDGAMLVTYASAFSYEQPPSSVDITSA